MAEKDEFMKDLFETPLRNHRRDRALDRNQYNHDVLIGNIDRIIGRRLANRMVEVNQDVTCITRENEINSLRKLNIAKRNELRSNVK